MKENEKMEGNFTNSKHFWRFPVYLFYLTLIFGRFAFDILFVLGFIIAAFGIFLYAKSRKELGNYYNSSPTVFKKHKLITTGFYRYIRHPGYVGSFLAMIGFILISKSIVSLIFCLVVCIPFGFYKIRFEERLLEKKFGKRFKEYQQNVPMVLPKL